MEVREFVTAFGLSGCEGDATITDDTDTGRTGDEGSSLSKASPAGDIVILSCGPADSEGLDLMTCSGSGGDVREAC